MVMNLKKNFDTKEEAKEYCDTRTERDSCFMFVIGYNYCQVYSYNN